jgi:hypothetical protein
MKCLYLKVINIKHRSACVPNVIGFSPSGGSESIFRSDFSVDCERVAVGERSFSLPVCHVTRVTHSALSAWVGAIQIPKFIYF